MRSQTDRIALVTGANKGIGWKYALVKVLGYCASKAALNMFTVQLAFELRDHGIAVNSVNPGFTATDLNASRGEQTVEEGAAEIVPSRSRNMDRAESSWKPRVSWCGSRR